MNNCNIKFKTQIVYFVLAVFIWKKSKPKIKSITFVNSLLCLRL